jgi:ribokinase
MSEPSPFRRIAVVGHVEHVTLGRVPAVPARGEIAYLAHPLRFPGGGGGMSYSQMVNGPTEAHLFTALGDDEAGAEVAAALARTGGHVHAARRAEPHTRAVVLVTPDGERTIVVVGETHQPRADDPLPWELLASCDAVYFTGQDPETLRLARRARVLVVTARRREALFRSGVRADVVVGSATDPRERGSFSDYPVAPGALVLTEGARGGRVETAAERERFPAAPSPPPGGAAYGAGDSFAGALTFYVGAGVPLLDACRRAAEHGAAVLRGFDPPRFQRRLELP